MLSQQDELLTYDMVTTTQARMWDELLDMYELFFHLSIPLVHQQLIEALE